MGLAVSKRRVQLLALLCLLLAFTSLSRPTSAEDAPSPEPYKDALALQGVNCTTSKSVFNHFIDEKGGQNYVIAGLKSHSSQSDWLNQPKWGVFVKDNSGVFTVASEEHIADLREGVPIEQNARVFLTDAHTLYLFYYDVDSNLKGVKYKYTRGAKKDTLTVDSTFKIPTDKALDDRNTPLWDIVGDKPGFYTPVGCLWLERSEEKNQDCVHDCFTVDQYCFYDFGLNKSLSFEQSPNLEGGPRLFYPGLRYNSLFCNTFSEKSSGDGKSRVLLIRNNEDPKNPIKCYGMEANYTQLQIWNDKWAANSMLNQCLGMETGELLGPPTSPTPAVPTPEHRAAAAAPTDPNDAALLFLVAAAFLDVLMTLLLAILIGTWFKSRRQVAAIAAIDEVD